MLAVDGDAGDEVQQGRTDGTVGHSVACEVRPSDTRRAAGPRLLLHRPPPQERHPRKIRTPAKSSTNPREICGTPPQISHPNRNRTIRNHQTNRGASARDTGWMAAHGIRRGIEVPKDHRRVATRRARNPDRAFHRSPPNTRQQIQGLAGCLENMGHWQQAVRRDRSGPRCPPCSTT